MATATRGFYLSSFFFPISIKSTSHECSSGRRWNLQKVEVQFLHSYPRIPTFFLHMLHLLVSFFGLSYYGIFSGRFYFRIESMLSFSSLDSSFRLISSCFFSYFHSSCSIFCYYLWKTICFSSSLFIFDYLKHLEHISLKVGFPNMSLQTRQSLEIFASLWLFDIW